MGAKIALIGECMLELRKPTQTSAITAENVDAGADLSLGYGGDTLNTAVYLARLGQRVDYFTALGDDTLSDWLIEQWRVEGVGCNHVTKMQGAAPGMYMVQTDTTGERSFLYWRDSSAARRMFNDEAAAQRLTQVVADYEWLYFSGITLAILDEPARSRFLRCVQHFQESGGKVAFDGNYRAGLWSSVAEARAAFATVYDLATIVLPTLEDECELFKEKDVGAVIERLVAQGIDEVVVKMGEHGCRVATDGGEDHIPALAVPVVDTTAAGDSFNAGYLNARLSGCTVVESALAGHELASVVIQYPGAVIPRDCMPE